LYRFRKNIDSSPGRRVKHQRPFSSLMHDSKQMKEMIFLKQEALGELIDRRSRVKVRSAA
jgi:hypothetical protein